MIRIENTSYTYENAANGAAISNVNVQIPRGQVVLLCGESGSGKTTFGRLVNGLIPSYYEGKLEGTMQVAGANIHEIELYELASHVGSVFQNPKSQFYTLQTDTEIVFACENMGMEREEILRRFDCAVDSLHIETLIGRNLFGLSGGEKQKIACASVHALMPEIIVLDEPSSNLDIRTILDLRKILLSWKAQGKTIVIAEHRISWLRGVVDRVLFFESGRIAQDLKADDFWGKPQTELHKMGLRAPVNFSPVCTIKQESVGQLEITDFQYIIKKEILLAISNLKIPKGAVVAVLGNNGAGKTTFARCLCGLLKKAKGTLNFEDKGYNHKQRIHKCYMVMQDVNHQLFSESVMDEVLLGMNALPDNREAIAENILSDLDLLDYKEAHPMSLSGGQRQRVAIAGAVASHKEIIVFDEPTSGLDYRHMQEVAENIRKLSAFGKTQFVITHDAELVAACCNYFIFLDDGKIVCSGTWSEANINYVAGYFHGG